MKNLMKKKYAVLILAALLIMGSTKAFASGGPFANIIGLIRNAFSAKTETVIDDTGREIAQIGTDSTEDIKEYIDGTYSKFIADIEAYKNAELARGKKEMDDYVNELKSQLDSVVTEEKNKLQQKITEKVDKDIDKIKKDLDKDIEKYIKDNYK